MLTEILNFIKVPLFNVHLYMTNAVAPTGLEPALPQKLDSKSSESTNSAREPYYVIVKIKPLPSSLFNAAINPDKAA